jgi:hypothetical protein
MRIASSKLRSRGTLGKAIVLGLLKRGDKVYTEIVSDCSAARLQSIIRGKASIDSVIASSKFILSMMHFKMLFIAKIYNAIIPFPTIRMNHTINACLTSNYALQPSSL